MHFIAGIDRLHQMLQWIEEQLQSMGLEPARLPKVTLASEEALVNIFNHAYQGRPEKVEILVNFFPESHIEITFKDYGPPFNPLDVQCIDLDRSIDEREIGGLGIHFMRKCVDEIRYARVEDKNVLVFVIRFSQKR